MIEVGFFFEGKVTNLLFSHDSRYLATEAFLDGGGFSTVSFWDVKETKSISWTHPKNNKGLPADIKLKEWSNNYLKVSVRWMEEEKRNDWFLEINNDQIQKRKDSKG